MNTSIEHNQLVNEIAGYCEKNDLTIFVHNYNYMAFDSWVLIIGKDKHRMKFSWDGKESNLGVEQSKFHNSNSGPNWELVIPSIGGTKTTQGNVFAFIKELLAKQFVI